VDPSGVSRQFHDKSNFFSCAHCISNPGVKHRAVAFRHASTALLLNEFEGVVRELYYPNLFNTLEMIKMIKDKELGIPFSTNLHFRC
jgi:hypothetical protein